MLEKKEINHFSLRKFYLQLLRNMVLATILVAIALFVGMCGYHGFEHMSWLDAFLNASMILSGMGPVSQLITTGGKLFAGFYALFSGLAFIAIMALVFAPIIHRFLRKVHMESNQDSKL